MLLLHHLIEGLERLHDESKRIEQNGVPVGLLYCLAFWLDKPQCLQGKLPVHIRSDGGRVLRLTQEQGSLAEAVHKKA